MEIPSNEVDLFTMYPNPAYQSITISTGIQKDPSELNVYDYMGRKIYQEFFIESSTIDISSFPAGMYLISVRNLTNIQTKKLLIVQ